MSFNTKNPYMATKLSSSPEIPISGTRGLYPKDDGWYDIDDNGNEIKIADLTEVNSVIPEININYEAKESDTTTSILDSLIKIYNEQGEEFEITKENCLNNYSPKLFKVTITATNYEHKSYVGYLKQTLSCRPDTLYLILYQEFLYDKAELTRLIRLTKPDSETPYIGRWKDKYENFEPLGHKVDTIDDDTTDSVHYPSTKAVADHVDTKLNDFWESTELPNGSVTTEKIADGVVTINKLSNDITAELNKIPPLENSVSELKDDLDKLNESGLVLKDEVIEEDIKNWLDEHPEATTTVQDKSLVLNKFKDGEFPFVTPEMYGAKGNGIDDDTTPIKNALDSGYPVVFGNKTYLINSEIDTGVAYTVIGNNTTIKTNKTSVGYLLTFSHKSICISGLKFDFEQKNAYGAIRISEPDNCMIRNIEVCNISEKRKNNGVSCIYITKPFNCDVSNIYIHDCTCEVNGIVGDDAGNVTGLLVQRFTGKCSIHDSYFENLHSVDSDGNITFEDSNAIYQTELNSEVASCHIYSCSGKDVGKRFIKTQCTCTVIIDNCNYLNTKNDFLVGIGIQSTEQAEQTEKGKGIISNCNLVNIAPCDLSVSTRPMLISTSEEVIVNNCRLCPGYMYAFGGKGDFYINNCVVKGYGFLIMSSESRYNVNDCVFSGMSVFYTNVNDSYTKFNNSLFYKSSEYDGLSYGSQCSTGAQDVYLDFCNCEFNDVSLSPGSAVFSLDGCVFNSSNSNYLVHSKTNVSDISYIRNCRFRNIGNDVVRSLPFFDIQNHKLCLENLVFEMGNSNSYSFASNYCELSIRSGVSMKESYFTDSVIESMVPYWEESEPTKKSFYCDGYKYLNVNDGKLYTFNKESMTWNPVN